MLAEWCDDHEAALRHMVEVQQTHDFLSTGVRQMLQQWVEFNGNGNPALDKDQVKAMNNNGYVNVPFKSWEQVRKPLGHYCFLFTA